MRCGRCHIDKAGSEFAPSMSDRSGGWCRDCHNAYNREKRRDPAYRAARAAEKRDALKVVRADVAQSKKHSLKARNKDLRRRYGISLAEYEARLAAQGGRCACCGAADPRGSGSFRVDHDHDTGAVRGLLCNPCNAGIGLLGDTPEALMRATKYLQANGSLGFSILAGTDISVPLQ